MPIGAQRVVVTGGAGFIGSHLIDRLIREEWTEVIAFDNLSRGRVGNVAQHQRDPRFQLIEGDVRDARAVSDAVRGAQLVFHLAAQSTVLQGVSDPNYTFSTNVVGTFNVLRASRSMEAPRVIFTSSSDVYGEPIGLPVDEDSPLLAINSYGASKVAGEAYCRAFRREFGVQVGILRIASVYGSRDRDRVIPLWVQQALGGNELHVYGGKQVIDLVWIDQVVEALHRAGNLQIALPPMNIASGTGTRIVDLARRIGRLAYGQPRIKLQPARPVDVTRFVASVDRMRQMLGVEPPLDPLMYLPELIPAPVGASS